jgi:1-acyl-sn-glycerol-3-phosphate acyltransferase
MIQLFLLKVFIFKTKIYYEDDNKQNKRITGSAIIISNHRSCWDGIVIALSFFSKRLHFLATDFYKDKRKVLKSLVRVAGGIFVAEDGRDFGFIEKSKKVAAKGRPILMFPEGGYKHTTEPSKFSAGYIMLAVKTGVKIVPVVNDFNYGLFKRVHLLIGNSIDLSGYSETELTGAKLKELNDEIMGKYISLFYQLKNAEMKGKIK